MHADSTSSPAAGRSRALRWVTWIVAALGLFGCAALLRELGTVRVTQSLQQLGPWLGWLFALEIGRVGCELLGTRTVLGSARVSTRRLLRGQLLGQTFDVIMPAGRASAEAVKASVYAQEIGAAHAAAAGTALQLAALVANAGWALIGFAVSVTSALPRPLQLGLLGYAAATTLLLGFVVLCALLPRVRRFARRVPFVHDTFERFALLIQQQPRRLLGAVGAQALGRGFQAAEIAVLSAALAGHVSLGRMVMGQAVYLVGAAAGDLVPAQLGTTDAAFVYAADAFGLTSSAAMAVTLALHAVQVAVAACAGAAALALWFGAERAAPAEVVASVPLDEPSH